jgi:hypothetical protein
LKLGFRNGRAEPFYIILHSGLDWNSNLQCPLRSLLLLIFLLQKSIFISLVLIPYSLFTLGAASLCIIDHSRGLCESNLL